ncbi:alpha/beta fold hydrolase [Paenibacillus spongiae]|uniref:Alpha/beta hydrolase n=1 Tax=Paenibacillus spongiae TaxID=2909671 RepID=A0ABY5SKW2_9BACL|nr:alpha/beta hydrolase [Paenibacillus spongiae]UVI33295.1 alpha/beta hydrolase [Paenibacillus spongiae]
MIEEYADINGYKMHYSELGTGTPIIFIHPPVLTSVNFHYQLQGLSAHFRTIAFDIRGHGRSGPSREKITYSLIVEDIKQLMDRLEIDKAYLCGYSTGGSIVLEFLLAQPDRAFGGIVIGGMSEVADRKLRTKISLGRICSEIGMVCPIALITAWAQSHSNTSFFRKLFNDANKTNPMNAKQYYQYSLHYDCTDRLRQISQPVLLVYGEKDRPFHPYAKLLHQRLAKNELYYFKNIDHRIPTKAAGKLNRLIKQFIDTDTPLH